MKAVRTIGILLMVIGSINWGLHAVGFNVVEKILGTGTVTDIIYILVGIAGLWGISLLMSGKKRGSGRMQEHSSEPQMSEGM